MYPHAGQQLSGYQEVDSKKQREKDQSIPIHTYIIG